MCFHDVVAEEGMGLQTRPYKDANALQVLEGDALMNSVYITLNLYIV
jgi:hypothetical protein